MAKPILIVKIPIYQYNDMGEAEFNRFVSGLTDQFNDYHDTLGKVKYPHKFEIYYNTK